MAGCHTSSSDGSETRDCPELRAELSTLHERVLGTVESRADADQRIRIAEAAHRACKSDLVRLERRIADLEQELAVYRGLLAPDTEQPPLDIHRVRVHCPAEGTDCRYRLLVTTHNDGDQRVEGTLDLVVVGERAGESVRLHHDVLEPTHTRFDFHRYQRLEGVLTLPADFQPRRLIIRLEPTEGPVRERRQAFPWEAIRAPRATGVKVDLPNQER